MVKYVENDDSFYIDKNKSDFWDYIFGKILHFSSSSQNPKLNSPASIQGINIIKERIMNAENTPNKYKLLIGLCVDYAFKQPNEFIEEYLKPYTQDTLQAYGEVRQFDDATYIPDARNISCMKGIYERFVVLLEQALRQSCEMGGNCTPDQEDVLENGFGPINVKDFKDIMNQATMEWSTEHLDNDEYNASNGWQSDLSGKSDDIINAQIQSIKQDFINFLIEKCLAIVNDRRPDGKKLPQLPNYLMETINNKAREYQGISSDGTVDESINIFRRMYFGGSKSRRNKCTRRRKYKKTHKKNNKNKKCKRTKCRYKYLKKSRKNKK